MMSSRPGQSQGSSQRSKLDPVPALRDPVLSYSTASLPPPPSLSELGIHLQGYGLGPPPTTAALAKCEVLWSTHLPAPSPTPHSADLGFAAFPDSSFFPQVWAGGQPTGQ